MAQSTFLTNHGLVLTYIGNHRDSTGLEIAQAAGITERAARKIIADLETDGYIERERIGRRNRYRVNATQPLRYLGGHAVTVGELLEVLGVPVRAKLR
ncbi:MAG: winged helix-turn-helix transcriptional regulator [Chloroflexi bacterium]|nr:winged helix-turn-helix transcriptional regulator [Chloroflexota bacterium]